ncbi:PglZ domain-containing protein [Halorubrum sp. SP9]|uniref:PglZ domain-containing protein n=1 Tax=Halorubrum sp. SP9 TaxID=1537267 RepID=UPI0010F53365|nr:PglZ domain-containing protein [Halorubrum sp. SP9]TKX69265.1 PglZ domain-containing protein [Halorubrum sp. SP9]
MVVNIPTSTAAVVERWLNQFSGQAVLVDDRYDILKNTRDEVEVDMLTIVPYNHHDFLEFRAEYEAARDADGTVVVALNEYPEQAVKEELGDVTKLAAQSGYDETLSLTPTTLIDQYGVELDSVADPYISAELDDFLAFVDQSVAIGSYTRNETLDFLLEYLTGERWRTPLSMEEQYIRATEDADIATVYEWCFGISDRGENDLYAHLLNQLPKVRGFEEELRDRQDITDFVAAVWTIQTLHAVGLPLDLLQAIVDKPPDVGNEQLEDLASRLRPAAHSDQIERTERVIDTDALQENLDGVDPVEGTKEFVLPSAARYFESEVIEEMLDEGEVTQSARRVKQQMEDAGNSTDRLQSAVSYFEQLEEVLSQSQAEPTNAGDWIDIEGQLTDLDYIADELGITRLHENQEDIRRRVDRLFCDIVEERYTNWVNSESVTLSWDILDDYVLPLLEEDTTVYYVVCDGLRFDHWQGVRDELSDTFTVEEDGGYISCLPTATPYARNSLMSGLSPREIEDEYGVKLYNHGNQNEKELLRDATGLHGNDLKYVNVAGKKTKSDRIRNIMEIEAQLKTFIYHFSDWITHGLETANLRGDRSFRHIPVSVFKDNLAEQLKEIPSREPNSEGRMILVSDHGATRADESVRAPQYDPQKSGTRYARGNRMEKADGCNIIFNDSVVEEYRLPPEEYLFAKHRTILSTRRNDDRYVHGGISLQEMVTPIAVLSW